MPSGYIIANVRVTNPAQYEEYKKWSTAAFQAHNAEICVRGGQVEVMEGDWTPERLVIGRGERVAYLWRKGEPWAAVASRAFWAS